MLYDAPLVLFALSFVAAIGFAVRSLLLSGVELSWAEGLATDYGLGAGVLTLWMLLLAAVGVAFTAPSIVAVAAPVGVAVAVRWQHGRDAGAGRHGPSDTRGRDARAARRTADGGIIPRRITTPAFLEFAPLAALVLILVAAAWIGLSQPETNWDTLSHWGLKAKAFHIHGTIWQRDYDAHNYYPLLAPLLTTWLYAVLGRVDEVLAKTISVGYGVALVALVYSALRQGGHSRATAGWLTLLLLVGANQLLQQLTMHQADLPLTFYLTGAFIHAHRWLQHEDAPRRLLLSGLFAGGAAWTKYEGLFLVGLMVAALLVTLELNRASLGKRLPALLSFGAAVAVPTLAWAAYRAVHGLAIEDEHTAVLLAPERVLPMVAEFARYLTAGRSAGFWLATLGVWLLFARRALEPRNRFYAIALALNLAGILWAFIADPEDPMGQVERAGGRLLMHVAPVAMLLLAGLLAQSRQAAQESALPRLLATPR